MDTFTTPWPTDIYTTNTIPDMGLHMVEKEKKREILMRGSTEFSYAVPTDFENKVHPSPKKFKDIDKEELNILYLDEKLSCAKISKRYGVSRSSIRNWLIRLDISRRDTYFKKGRKGRNKGIPRTNEEREKISEGRLEIHIPKEIIERLYWSKGLTLDKVAKKLNVGRWVIYDNMRRYGIPTRNHSECKKGDRNYMYGKTHTKEAIDKILISRNRLKPNKVEQKLNELLQKHYPNEWEYVGDGKIIIHGLNPDFISKDRSKIIELFGDYWHTKAAYSWRQTEFGRKAIFSQLGYKILIIYDKELKNPVKVLEKIRNFT